MKKDFTKEVSQLELCMVALFKLSGNFLGDVFAKHFLTNSQTTNLVIDFIEINVFDKNV